MSDYRDWCRLCGDIYGSQEIHPDNLKIIDEIFDVSTLDLKICNTCNDHLTELNKIISSSKRLEKLYSGLLQENDADLTAKRLNAYRAHFNLSNMIPEEQVDYIEFKEEQDDDAEVEEIIEELDEACIIQEEFEIAEEEVYEFSIKEDSDDSHDITYISEDSHQRAKPGSLAEKTEDEKLFTFQCHLCYHPEFTKMNILSLHCKQVHNSSPRVLCCYAECGAVLSTWRRLMIHKEKHFPNDDQLRCSECLKVYITPAGLLRHMESHKLRFICSHCGKAFKETKTLKSHEQTHLRSLDERRNHQCDYSGCGMKFITKQALQNHIAMKHQKIVNYYCSEADCNKSFYTRKHLYEHLRVHSERRFPCDQCNFKAKTKSALNSHKDCHSVDESYSCDICNAVFSVYRRLKTHMICHSNETPFKCSFCESAFKRNKDLKSHLNTHTKERPFTCQFCSRSFANAANCRKHKLKDHPHELREWEAENGVGGRKKLECYQ